MKKKAFLGSLAISVAALLGSNVAHANVPNVDLTISLKRPEIVQPLEKNFVLEKSTTTQQFAQHRSHYSHSSHSSHYSHRSHYSSSW